LKGRRMTVAPTARAHSAVASLEPSSTTSTSKSGAHLWIWAIVAAIALASLKAGTIATFLRVRARTPPRPCERIGTAGAWSGRGCAVAGEFSMAYAEMLRVDHAAVARPSSRNPYTFG